MKKIKHALSFCVSIATLMLATETLHAQNQTIKTLKVDDGTNSTTFNSNALIDLQSGSKGLLLPRVPLTATNSASPLTAFVAGMTVYNTASAGSGVTAVTPGYYYSDGSQWVRISTNAWALLGNAGTTAGTNFLGTTDNQDLVFKRNNVQSGWLNDAALNTSFGVLSLPITTTAVASVAVGYNALGASTAGSSNTAVGSYALTNATGASNTMVGQAAATGLTTGSGNTGIGNGVFGAARTGDYNTAMGYNALPSVNGGSYNIGIGYNALTNVTTGSNNIAIGYQTNVVLPTASNQMNIGNAIFGTGLTGSVSSPAGNIGINTTTPGASLEINSGTSDVSGLKFTNFNSSTTIGTGQAIGVDVNGNVITVPNPTATSVTTAEAASTVGTVGTAFNVNDGGWTQVSNTSQSIIIPAGGKALFINFMLGIDYGSNPSGSGYAYYTAMLYVDGGSTNVFQTTQEPGSGGLQAQFNLSTVKFLTAGSHTLDIRMKRTTNNGTSSGANMSCQPISISFNVSYLN